MAKAVVKIDGYKILSGENEALLFENEIDTISIIKVNIREGTLFQERKEATKVKNVWLIINKGDSLEILPIINGQPLRNQAEIAENV